MASRNPRFRNLVITFSSLAIIIGGLVSFYFIYTQLKAQYLDARNQRVLNRMRENIRERNSIYSGNARNTANRDVEKLRARAFVLINEKINEDYLAAMRDSLAQTIQNGTGAIPSASSLTPPLLKDPSQVELDIPRSRFNVIRPPKGVSITSISFKEFEERYSQQLNLNYSLEPYDPNEPDSLFTGNEVVLRAKTSGRLAYNNYELAYQLKPAANEFNGIRARTGKGQDSYVIRMQLGIGKFMEPLLRPDVFDDFLILRDTTQLIPDNVVFSTLVDKRIALQLQRKIGILSIINPDSALQAKLADIPYRLYTQSMNFQGEELVLCGLVKTSNFNRQRQQISTIAILLISLLVFVVLLSFPVLKLFLMGEFERMRLSDLLLSSITAILGTSLIAILLIDTYAFNGTDRKLRSRQLINLSEKMEDQLAEEINLIYKQLEAYDTLSVCDLETRREVVRPLEQASNIDSVLYPRYYPYFNNIFWVGRNKMLARQWTPGTTELPKVSVSGRPYYEDLMAGKGWKLPGDSSKQFTMASIRTRVNGEHTAIIAKRSQANILKPEAQPSPRRPLCEQPKMLEKADILFASVDLYSVVRPMLPPGFGFAIISPNGSVLFHSDQTRNLQENFLEETNLPALEAAMFSRSPLFQDGTYLGEDHDFFLQPVEQLPLFLVSFRKRSFYRLTHAQILSLSFLMTLAAFLAGSAFVGLLILLSPRNPVLKHDQFTFDWLRPFYRHARRYRELIINNLYTLLLAGIFARDSVQPLVAISIIAISYIFTFLLAFFRLNKNAHQQFLWKEYQRIFWVTVALLVAGNIAMQSVLSPEDYFRVFGFELLQGIILMGVIGRVLADSRAPYTEWVRELYSSVGGAVNQAITKTPFMAPITRYLIQILDAQRSYRLFLTTWLLILGVFPVVKFYEIAYNREAHLKIRFAQIQMAETIQTRREAIDLRYQSIPSDSLRHELSSSLLRNGLYTEPYFGMEYQARDSVNTPLIGLGQEAVPPLSKEYRRYDSLISMVRPRYDALARQTNQIRLDGSANSRWQWVESRDTVETSYHKWLNFSYSDDFILRARLPFYHFPTFNPFRLKDWNNPARLFFWLLVLTFVAMIYVLIRFMVEKLFARDALKVPTPDPIVAKHSLLQSDESIFLVVPLRAVEKDYLSILDLKVAEEQEGRYMPVPDRFYYRFKLNDQADKDRLREILDRTPSPTGPLHVMANRTDNTEEEDLFSNELYTLYDLPLIILDYFESDAQNPEQCRYKLELLTRLNAYGVPVVVISLSSPLEVQNQFAATLTGIEEEDSDPQNSREHSRNLQALGQALSSFSKLDFPMERWEIFDYQTEALEFIKGKHAFLYVTSSAVLQEEQHMLRSLQVEVASSGSRTIKKTVPNQNTLVIDETYNEVLLDDQLDLVHRWLDFEQERGIEHQITIISTITPAQIEEIYKEGDCDEHELQQKLRSWRRVLSLFYKGVVSQDPRIIPPEERVADLIRRECVNGPFLQSIQDELLEQLQSYSTRDKADIALKEEIILRIENRAHLYYHSLWASSTKEERYLIFDLAQDGLVNASNLAGIQKLIRKGIIVQTQDTLIIMNKSFRNFVLTVVKPEDALKMEIEIESQDSWRRLRTPISIVLFGLGAFIFYTQRDVLNETLAFVTGIAALIPTLGRVIDSVTGLSLASLPRLWSRPKKKKEEE